MGMDARLYFSTTRKLSKQTVKKLSACLQEFLNEEDVSITSWEEGKELAYQIDANLGRFWDTLYPRGNPLKLILLRQWITDKVKHLDKIYYGSDVDPSVLPKEWTNESAREMWRSYIKEEP